MTESASLQDDAELWRRWFQAAGDPSFDAALRGVYDQLDEAIQQRGPTCWLSGKCCHFDAYGHRLYVTAVETAWVLTQVGDAAKLGEVDPRGACPFQVDKRCTVHAVRPLGCRVFFCQEGTQDWQHGVYERFQGELRGLHETHALPYRYVEWRAALEAGRLYLSRRERSSA